MKVFARLFQKAAGSWGRAPSRSSQRAKLLQRRFDLRSKYVLLCGNFAKKNGEKYLNAKNELP
jgi:hypothetical protein